MLIVSEKNPQSTVHSPFHILFSTSPQSTTVTWMVEPVRLQTLLTYMTQVSAQQ